MTIPISSPIFYSGAQHYEATVSVSTQCSVQNVWGSSTSIEVSLDNVTRLNESGLGRISIKACPDDVRYRLIRVGIYWTEQCANDARVRAIAKAQKYVFILRTLQSYVVESFARSNQMDSFWESRKSPKLAVFWSFLGDVVTIVIRFRNYRAISVMIVSITTSCDQPREIFPKALNLGKPVFMQSIWLRVCYD